MIHLSYFTLDRSKNSGIFFLKEKYAGYRKNKNQLRESLTYEEYSLN